MRIGTKLIEIPSQLIRILFGFLSDNNDYVDINACDVDKNYPLISFKLLSQTLQLRHQDIITRLSLTIPTYCSIINAATWLVSLPNLRALDLHSFYNAARSSEIIEMKEGEFYIDRFLNFDRFISIIVTGLRLYGVSNYGLTETDLAVIRKTGRSPWKKLEVLQLENVFMGSLDRKFLANFFSDSPLKAISLFWDSKPLSANIFHGVEPVLKPGLPYPENRKVKTDLSWLQDIKGLLSLAIGFYGFNLFNESVAPVTEGERLNADVELDSSYHNEDREYRESIILILRIPENLRALRELYLTGYNKFTSNQSSPLAKFNFPQLRLLALTNSDSAGYKNLFLEKLIAPRLENLFYYDYQLREPGKSVHADYELPDGCKFILIVPFRGGKGAHYSPYTFGSYMKNITIIRGYGLLTDDDLSVNNGETFELRKIQFPPFSTDLYNQLKFQRMHYEIAYRYHLGYTTDTRPSRSPEIPLIKSTTTTTTTTSSSNNYKERDESNAKKANTRNKKENGRDIIVIDDSDSENSNSNNYDRENMKDIIIINDSQSGDDDDDDNNNNNKKNDNDEGNDEDTMEYEPITNSDLKYFSQSLTEETSISFYTEDADGLIHIETYPKK